MKADIASQVGPLPQLMVEPTSARSNSFVGTYEYLAPEIINTKIISYAKADWAGSPLDRRITFGYCVLIGENMISRRSKKQGIVVRSGIEVEYNAMAIASCENTCLDNFSNNSNLVTLKLLHELSIIKSLST